MLDGKSFSIWYSYSIDRTVAGRNVSITISGDGSYGYMHHCSPEIEVLEPEAVIICAANAIREYISRVLAVAGLNVPTDAIFVEIKGMSPID